MDVFFRVKCHEILAVVRDEDEAFIRDDWHEIRVQGSLKVSEYDMRRMVPPGLCQGDKRERQTFELLAKLFLNRAAQRLIAPSNRVSEAEWAGFQQERSICPFDGRADPAAVAALALSMLFRTVPSLCDEALQLLDGQGKDAEHQVTHHLLWSAHADETAAVVILQIGVEALRRASFPEADVLGRRMAYEATRARLGLRLLLSSPWRLFGDDRHLSCPRLRL